MTYQNIEVEVKGPIAFVRLNRPDKRNALSIALRQEVVDCLGALSVDDSVVCLILTGNGKAFCAGFDLDEFKDPQPGMVETIERSSLAFHAAVGRFEKPIVAAINGAAVAGGLDLALMCDIRICSEDAIFGHPELRFGSPLLYGLLKEAVGGGPARDLCLSGRTIGAEEALRIGLVSRVTTTQGLMESAREMAEEVCKTPLKALVREKRRILEAAARAIDEATSDGGPSFVEVIRETLG
ncbi:MAG: enoyl-CoA hydratase/isomerase family protein [Deltaproteobacteria bacterium]|nr:enoyl-CoA hydratase/isomerase family protein [Deltaproteobacteria bacterium]MBW1948951.1 enoyl-CoA hydratase/isomerase family protein [Deltaproteobacteria bacterium]MBW2007130.1 enoyl-CoA hydratase/isomerase family protein [Deltaproteobacteria bacterium]